jgi:hypothetical protein
MNKEKTIVKMIFGSHLYGCATATSDKDFKGIFLPTKEQIYLGKIPKSYSTTPNKAAGEKNTVEDIDLEMYSLHYFIKLACEGQTVALDMLHAPKEMLIETSAIWDEIVNNREKFYTKNLKAFVGYARGQAAKYGIRGSRLNAADEVIDFLSKHEPLNRLSTVWGKLPINEHCRMLEDSKDGIKQYQVCGKTIQDTSKVGYFKDIMQNFYDNYGSRAKLAAENKGIDWKAISHAFRAAYQVKQLLTENTIIFPLKEAAFLTKVKQGLLDYTTEASPELERLMDEVEVLSQNSTLPSKPDYRFWDRFIVETVEQMGWEIQC